MSKTKNQQQRSTTKGVQNKNKQKKSNGGSKPNKRSQPGFTAPGRLSAAPTAMGRTNKTPKPKMITLRNGDCTIRHREYISEISAGPGSPSQFSVQSLPINPALPATFPWLSSIAPRFEKYQFKKLKFCYETEAPTTLGGSLLLTLDYDASDPAPISKVQAMSYENAVRSPPWEECCHTSRSEDLSNQKGYFTRTQALAANQDIKLYDTGNLFVCSQNVATANSLLGELYVEYEVLLMTPQISSDGNAPSLGGSAIGVVGGSAANPLGTAPVVDPQSLGFTLSNASVITFQVSGTVMITADIVGTVITVAPGFTPGLGVAAASTAVSVIATGALSALSTQTFLVSAGGTISVAASATTVTQGRVRLAVCPQDSQA